MPDKPDQKRPTESWVTAVEVTVEEVNRVLEVGRLLFSVLIDNEKAELAWLLSPSAAETKNR